MAYKPTASSPPSPVAPAPAPAPASSGALTPEPDPSAVLRPSPAAISAVEARDPGLLPFAQDQARSATLKTINAWRTLAPIALHAVAAGGTDRDQSTRFAETMGLLNVAACAAVRELGLDPLDEKNRWSINVIERSLAGAVDGGRVPGEELARSIGQAASRRGADWPAWVDHDEPTTVSLALLKALAPVARAQDVFDFYRPRDADLDRARDAIIEETVRAMESLADPLAAEGPRRTLFLAIAEEAGEGLASAWRRETTRARDALMQKSQAELKAWRAANPNGLPVESVFQLFHQHMHRLVALARHPKASTRR